jgi:hypothetical protein
VNDELEDILEADMILCVHLPQVRETRRTENQTWDFLNTKEQWQPLL